MRYRFKILAKTPFGSTIKFQGNDLQEAQKFANYLREIEPSMEITVEHKGAANKNETGEKL